jgi:hypothetical protein
MSKAVPKPDVYGEPVVYVCICRRAHATVHICALCRSTSDYRPSEPWVEAELCRECLEDQRQRLEAELAVVNCQLRRAVLALDPVSGERIPPAFLSSQGWER